ncbi:glycosyltransferase [Paenibacillus humicola]|uniref:glycosyltransferase n=1 Tax=Paenibacillus humicola TaxID=3110540 RepID=UPI00237C1A82|nr:hypothetical protein [Paenibacillus humicola]
MKILIASFPALGHFLPVVPLAWAARAAGHEVLVVTAGEAVGASERAGLPWADASPGIQLRAVAERSKEDSLEQFQNPMQVKRAWPKPPDLWRRSAT